MKRVKTILFIFFCGLILNACGSQEASSQPNDSSNVPVIVPTKTSYVEPPSNPVVKKPDIRRVTLSAVGDIMMHMPQTRAGIRPDGTLNYDSFFEYVKPYIETSDLAIGNLELTITETGPYSGYPVLKHLQKYWMHFKPQDLTFW
jgi:hypothetical protein